MQYLFFSFVTFVLTTEKKISGDSHTPSNRIPTDPVKYIDTSYLSTKTIKTTESIVFPQKTTQPLPSVRNTIQLPVSIVQDGIQPRKFEINRVPSADILASEASNFIYKNLPKNEDAKTDEDFERLYNSRPQSKKSSTSSGSGRRVSLTHTEHYFPKKYADEEYAENKDRDYNAIRNYFEENYQCIDKQAADKNPLVKEIDSYNITKSWTLKNKGKKVYRKNEGSRRLSASCQGVVSNDEDDMEESSQIPYTIINDNRIIVLQTQDGECLNTFRLKDQSQKFVDIERYAISSLNNPTADEVQKQFSQNLSTAETCDKVKFSKLENQGIINLLQKSDPDDMKTELKQSSQSKAISDTANIKKSDEERKQEKVGTSNETSDLTEIKTERATKSKKGLFSSFRKSKRTSITGSKIDLPEYLETSTTNDEEKNMDNDSNMDNTSVAGSICGGKKLSKSQQEKVQKKILKHQENISKYKMSIQHTNELIADCNKILDNLEILKLKNKDLKNFEIEFIEGLINNDVKKKTGILLELSNKKDTAIEAFSKQVFGYIEKLNSNNVKIEESIKKEENSLDNKYKSIESDIL